MPRPKSKAGYKTKRKYSCPYCDYKDIRSELVTHVQEEHESLIPENYTAARVVYDHINGKNYGTCMICGKKVYEWNEKIWRYKNLCDNPKCREAVSLKAKNNHLDDPRKQMEMLKNRKISGEYTFSDGGKRSYVASYEKKCLEFMDKVMNIPSSDVETPGPVIEYMYEGEKHFWISDIFYIPAMLVMDVKDGGSNPNTRPMESYREKQLAKENAIAEAGEYNYLRLTDNDFGQLLSAIADIRYGNMVDDEKKGVYIHEGMGALGNAIVGMDAGLRGKDFIIPGRMLSNTFNDADDFDTYIFGNTDLESAIYIDQESNVVIAPLKTILEKVKTIKPTLTNQRYRKIVFNKDKSNMAKMADKIKKEREEKKQKDRQKKQLEYANILYGEDAFLSMKDLYRLPFLEEYVDPALKVIEESFKTNAECHRYYRLAITESLVRPIGKHLHLMLDPDRGFYLSTEDRRYNIASDYYDTDEKIPQDLIDLMDDLYESNVPRGGDNS